MNVSTNKLEDEKNVTVTAEEALKRSGTIYRAAGNLFVVRKTERAIPHAFDGTTRGNISEFSPGSGVRMRRYLRECLADYQHMVTLTYPGFFPTNGPTVKEHLRRFIQEVRRQHTRECEFGNIKESPEDFSAFWFLEFQSRGAPHFHIFLTWAPKRQWVAERWYHIVNSEDDRHLRAGTRTEQLIKGRSGTVAYASKYAAKMEQKAVPEDFKNVGRFWGVTGRRATLSAATFVDSRPATAEKAEQTVNMIRKYVRFLIRSGRAEVLHKKSGEVLVLNIIEYWDQRKMRSLVARLSAAVMRWDNMFIDAELDI